MLYSSPERWRVVSAPFAGEGTGLEKLADSPELTRMVQSTQHCLPKASFEDTFGILRPDTIKFLIFREMGSHISFRANPLNFDLEFPDAFHGSKESHQCSVRV